MLFFIFVLIIATSDSGSRSCCYAGHHSQPVSFLKCKLDHVPIQNFQKFSSRLEQSPKETSHLVALRVPDHMASTLVCWLCWELLPSVSLYLVLPLESFSSFLHSFLHFIQGSLQMYYFFLLSF